MKSAQEITAMFGIPLTDFRAGDHKTICPQCSHTRKHKRDRCLSVRVDEAGVTWNCWHCGWRPDEGFLGGLDTGPRPPYRARSQMPPEASASPARGYAALQDAARQQWGRR